MDIYQNFLELAENDPEYGDVQGQFRQSLGTFLRQAEREQRFEHDYGDTGNEFMAGRMYQEFEDFHREMSSGDNSPDGRMSQALIKLGVRRSEDWWRPGETPPEYRGR